MTPLTRQMTMTLTMTLDNNDKCIPTSIYTEHTLNTDTNTGLTLTMTVTLTLTDT
jgi:hypothetical protein